MKRRLRTFVHNNKCGYCKQAFFPDAIPDICFKCGCQLLIEPSKLDLDRDILQTKTSRSELPAVFTETKPLPALFGCHCSRCGGVIDCSTGICGCCHLDYSQYPPIQL